MLETCKNKYYDLLESIQDLLLHIYLNQIRIINNKELNCYILFRFYQCLKSSKPNLQPIVLLFLPLLTKKPTEIRRDVKPYPNSK